MLSTWFPIIFNMVSLIAGWFMSWKTHPKNGFKHVMIFGGSPISLWTIPENSTSPRISDTNNSIKFHKIPKKTIKFLCFPRCFSLQNPSRSQVSGTTERLEGRMKSLESDLREEQTSEISGQPKENQWVYKWYIYNYIYIWATVKTPAILNMYSTDIGLWKLMEIVKNTR